MWDPKAEGRKGREGDLWHRLSEILKRVIWTNSTAESQSILLGLDTPPSPSPRRPQRKTRRQKLQVFRTTCSQALP